MANRKTTTPTLKILRALLLFGLVGFVVGVYALYRFGRAGRPGEEGSGGRPAAEASAERPAVMSGRGFDYTISQDERPIARIRAERVVSEQEDEVVLEGLNPVEIYRQDGDIYRVFSDQGTYNLDTQETVLRGNVRLEGPNGLSLETRGLSMGERAQLVTSDFPVRFRMAGEFRGHARRLEANLTRDLFTLSGNVVIGSVSAERDPLRLTAKRIYYERSEGFIRAVGDVRFDRAGSFLRAAKMQFFLTPDERRLRYVSAQQGIIGRFVKRFSGGLVRTVELAGDELAVVLDPTTGDPTEAEIRSPDAVARLASIDEGALVRQIVAPLLHARFENGDVRYAEAVGLVHLREFPAYDPGHLLSWGCGERAEVWIDPAGQIREARFYERVEFRQARGLVNADRLDLSADSAEMTMIGEPARFVGAEGELTAPTLYRRTETGEVRAVGGVRGRFDRTGGGISVGGAEGTIRLESVEALWNPTTESFKFYQDVRVWQEENLLLAQEVENFSERNLMVARGGVKTILEPERGDDEAGDEAGATEGGGPEGGEDPAADGGGGTGADGTSTEPPDEADEAVDASDDEASGLGDEPIEITAEWMEYESDNRIARYHERVVMTQAGRRMTCDTAEARLAEAGGVETLDCRGNARVVDKVAGRTVTGENAFYRVEYGEVLFEGDPVRMVGDKGERVEGGTLVYDLVTGGARITPGTSRSPNLESERPEGESPESASPEEESPPASTNPPDDL